MAMNDSTTGFNAYSHTDLSEKMSSTNSTVANAIGDLSITAVANVYEGGFAGISESGIKELQTQIRGFANELQNTIDGFDANADLTAGLAEGSKAQVAASDFIKDIKELLKAYVSTLNAYATIAEEAYANYTSADTSVGGSVDTTSGDVSSAADAIKLD